MSIEGPGQARPGQARNATQGKAYENNRVVLDNSN